MRSQRLVATALAITFSAVFFMQNIAASDRAGVTRSQPKGQLCDRACLYGHLDRYLDALEDKDPQRLPWAPMAKTSENNVMLMIGDGLWGTITGLGDYQLKFADPDNGEVGYFGAVEETGAVSPFVVRLRIEDGRIAESETLIRRAADQTGVMAEPKFENKPVLNEVMPEQDRLPRERLISIADGYFDTLQLNDGALFTHFDPQCNRVENGVQTTNNPELSKLHMTLTMGCEEQFKLGYFRFDDRLRARRYPLVDVERGLVLAGSFIDHAGRVGTFKLSNGKTEESRYRRPHSYYLLELFKVNKEGKIRQIEAVFMSVPYHMPSPWK
jgi:hypothetical protein